MYIGIKLIIFSVNLYFTLVFIFRDIAARNILVFNHECIKLADFGLSREINENFYLGNFQVITEKKLNYLIILLNIK